MKSYIYFFNGVYTLFIIDNRKKIYKKFKTKKEAENALKKYENNKRTF
jgi:hypothetical protein